MHSFKTMLQLCLVIALSFQGSHESSYSTGTSPSAFGKGCSNKYILSSALQVARCTSSIGYPKSLQGRLEVDANASMT